MGMIFTILLAIIFAEALWQVLLTFWDWITYERKKDMSDKYVTLDEFMNERGDFVKQVVYKVDGDFNGDINGDNVTVILMGDGNINGDIKAKNGEVFVHHGDINGNVKADKVLCPTLPTQFEDSNPVRCKCESCMYYVPNSDKQHFWCTQGGMLHLCIKEGTTICKYYEGKYDY